MATSEYSTDHSPNTAAVLKLPTMLRLGVYQMGLGIMSILTLGVLNRVMIDELKVPALITAGAIAMHQFVAPARVWFGQLSDSKPLFGMNRTGYVWLGTLSFAAAAFVAVQVIWQLNASLQATGWSLQSYAWVGLLGLVFAVYGLALSAGSTPFAALLVDVSEEEQRSKLVGIVWSMLMVGIVIGAIISSTLLKQISLDAPLEVLQDSINRLFLVIPAIVVGMALFATVGVEKRYSRYRDRSTLADREDSITLGRALRVLTASPQTGIFFTFLVVMTISLFMQEPILEPYGGEVFGMTISETTRLNAFWGLGTLVGLSTAGFLIVPRLGKKPTARLGCLLVAGCFVIIILAGLTKTPQMLMGALLLLGIGFGIVTNGAISLMLDLTAAETAGTFIGAWGLAQAMARAVATVTGGTLLDIGRQIFSVPLLSYSLVFGLQAIGMLCAIALLSRVDVQAFRSKARVAIAQVLEGEID